MRAVPPRDALPKPVSDRRAPTYSRMGGACSAWSEGYRSLRIWLWSADRVRARHRSVSTHELENSDLIRIRMQRFGRTHRPFYRIGVMDSRERRNGNMIENLGWFNPMEQDESKQLSLKGERIQHWLTVGAKPSETVRDILGKQELLTDKLRAEWERDRELARNRLTCKQHAAAVDAALAELTELSESAETDVSSFLTQAKAAKVKLKRAISRAKIDWAQGAVTDAQRALADAKEAEASAKPAEEATADDAEGGSEDGAS